MSDVTTFLFKGISFNNCVIHDFNFPCKNKRICKFRVLTSTTVQPVTHAFLNRKPFFVMLRFSYIFSNILLFSH